MLKPGSSPRHRRRYVIVVADGAADRLRVDGRSPLAMAAIPACDFVAAEGICGRVQTLYPDLPKESLVAQLGMLGWDPHRYYPHGRASLELAADGTTLAPGDLAFRANLVRMEGARLVSYSASLIPSATARPLIERLQAALGTEFPDLEIRHRGGFRNCLVMRGARVDPRLLRCAEPHECEGMELDLGRPVRAAGPAAAPVAERLNRYLERAAGLLAGEAANRLLPWSPSEPVRLPSFAATTGFRGGALVVGYMDFLHGLARTGGLDFCKLGNGTADTDYRGKGERVVQALAEGYSLVFCHVNAPDEASHLHDTEMKVRSLEQIDRWVVRPVVEYFRRRPQELGGVLVLPDHYTNCRPANADGQRSEAHSLEPVPFALWNGRDRDEVTAYGEDAAAAGRHGERPLNHLELLPLLGVAAGDGARRRRAVREEGSKLHALG